MYTIMLIGGIAVGVDDYKPVEDPEKGRGYLCLKAGIEYADGNNRERDIFFIPRERILFFKRKGNHEKSKVFDLPDRFDHKA